MQAEHSESDRLIAGKREYYMLCADSVRNSKLAQKLARRGPALTARNLNTVRKLLALLDA